MSHVVEPAESSVVAAARGDSIVAQVAAGSAPFAGFVGFEHQLFVYF